MKHNLKRRPHGYWQKLILDIVRAQAEGRIKRHDLHSELMRRTNASSSSVSNGIINTLISRKAGLRKRGEFISLKDSTFVPVVSIDRALTPTKEDTTSEQHNSGPFGINENSLDFRAGTAFGGAYQATLDAIEGFAQGSSVPFAFIADRVGELLRDTAHREIVGMSNHMPGARVRRSPAS